MDITFVLCPNLIGMLGLSILLIFTRFNFYLEKKKLSLFRAAAVVGLVIIVFEVMDYLLAHSPFPGAYLFRRVTSATGFALSPVFPLILAHIAGSTRLSKWIAAPAVLNAVLSYASIFTGHMFYIDEFNSYYREPLFIAMIGISVFYLGLLIYISFKNLQSVHAREALFLICIAAVILAGNLLEILLYFHFFIWNSCAVLLICYYLFLHIQYFKYDPLTKAYNRNMFSAELGGIAHKGNVGVISFDLDNLKAINDLEGHEQGDRYIVASAALIDKYFSGVGRLYRIGGDEFVVLISGTSEDIIRDRIARFQEGCAKGGVSVSCGYSFLASPTDAAQMLRDADMAMYENKRNRRMNR